MTQCYIPGIGDIDDIVCYYPGATVVIIFFALFFLVLTYVILWKVLWWEDFP